MSSFFVRAVSSFFVRAVFMAVDHEHTHAVTVAWHSLHTRPWPILLFLAGVDAHSTVDPLRFIDTTDECLGFGVLSTCHTHQKTVLLAQQLQVAFGHHATVADEDHAAK